MTVASEEVALSEEDKVVEVTGADTYFTIKTPPEPESMDYFFNGWDVLVGETESYPGVEGNTDLGKKFSYADYDDQVARFTANWVERKSITFNFDVNGGTCEYSTSNYIVQESETETEVTISTYSADAVIRDGYELIGWTYTDASGAEQTVAPDKELTFSYDDVSEVNFTAVWNPVINVNFYNEDDGTLVSSNQITGVSEGDTISVTLPAAITDSNGRTFVTWASTFSGAKYGQAGDTFTYDWGAVKGNNYKIPIYAKWILFAY